MPVGAPSFREALRWGVETYHALKKRPARARALHRGRRRGRVRPEPRQQRGGRSSCCWRPSRRPATRRASRSRIALDPAATELFDDGTLRASRARAGDSRPAEMVDYWADLVERYPIVSIEDGMAEDDWDGWKTAHPGRRRPRPARRRRPVRHQHRAAERGIDARRRQQHPHQGQPDRHAHRDARRGRAGRRARGYTSVISPSHRARPRTRRSPTSRWPPTAGRSRPARRPAAIASRSTTSCCASRATWVRRRPTAGGAAGSRRITGRAMTDDATPAPGAVRTTACAGVPRSTKAPGRSTGPTRQSRGARRHAAVRAPASRPGRRRPGGRAGGGSADRGLARAAR